MKWYHYAACVLAGLFLTNAIPLFVHGVSGDAFPSPFSSPPGKGLSSPTVNVLWGLANLVIGYILFRVGKVSSANRWSLLAFLVGAAYMSISLSIVFVDKMH